MERPVINGPSECVGCLICAVVAEANGARAAAWSESGVLPTSLFLACQLPAGSRVDLADRALETRGTGYTSAETNERRAPTGQSRWTRVTFENGSESSVRRRLQIYKWRAHGSGKRHSVRVTPGAWKQ
ncbi:hypothetical protein MRX96_007116 [Rhipicephalus microplus]